LQVLGITATPSRGPAAEQATEAYTRRRRLGMRFLIITGILLAALGAFIVLKGVSVRSEGTVSIGPIHGTVQERHTIPPLLGWVAIVGGVLVVIAGTRQKR
jgi:hypothetical protein